MANFDILLGSEVVGSLTASAYTRFDRLQIGGLGVQSFHTGASVNPTFQLAGIPPFSIFASPFVQVNYFPAPLCDDAQCDNGAKCANPDKYDFCECSILYSGQNCSDLASFCPTNDADVCLNGGICVENDARSLLVNVAGKELLAINTTACNCSDGITGPYRGAQCEIPPPCDIEPCFNGGVCINGLLADYTCDCSATTSPSSTNPFTGLRCETHNTSVCDANPCENGGVCSEDVTVSGKYSCACTGGWTGANCNLAPTDGCATGGLCRMGVCVPSANSASTPAFTHCVCSFGWTGALCDTPPPSCSDITCFNEGICVGFPGGTSPAVACICRSPWVGDVCQFNSTDYLSDEQKEAKIASGQ